MSLAEDPNYPAAYVVSSTTSRLQPLNGKCGADYCGEAIRHLPISFPEKGRVRSAGSQISTHCRTSDKQLVLGTGE